MSEIRRIGAGARWTDVVVHAGIARWVEVAADGAADTAEQVRQVLEQIDATLAELGSARDRLLQITIYLADLADAPKLNRLWDAWVVPGAAPSRACVQAGLSGALKVEMIVLAAVP
jgi:enamine deaminase RidA (YjgF/YER057c/UK114 family)